MKYTLMHKHTAVAEVEIDSELGVITAIGKVINKEHLPVGILHTLRHSEIVDRIALNNWWRGRSIPASRMGIADAFETLGVYNSGELLTKCFGLSLSDQYWIRPSGSEINWKSVNFFDNDFSDDIGDVLLGTGRKVSDFDFSSPDNTSDGNLKKRWKIIDGKRCLLKSGVKPYCQQPVNEVAASLIMEKLGIAHVPYSVISIENEPFSVCEDFVTADTELISANRIMQTRPKENHENSYLHYVNICKELGIDIVPALDEMILVDYIIANEDRHFNNFGLLRNAETLEWIAVAPIFDNGTSLWWNTVEDSISEADIKCKPFKRSHGEQLMLVSDMGRFDLSKLDGIDEEIIEIMLTDRFITEKRARIIASEVRKRIDRVKDFALHHESGNIPDSGDADEVTAEKY